MATPENTQVVSDLYASFGRGDLAAACALVAEDVVLHCRAQCLIIPAPMKAQGRSYLSSRAQYYQLLLKYIPVA